MSFYLFFVPAIISFHALSYSRSLYQLSYRGTKNSIKKSIIRLQQDFVK